MPLRPSMSPLVVATSLALAALACLPSLALAARADRTAPTAPRTIAAVATSTSSVRLTWGASRDARGVTAYLVYRDGARRPTITRAASARTWTDTKLETDSLHSYLVRARDRAGNLSAPRAVRVRTLPATRAPAGADPIPTQPAADPVPTQPTPAPPAPAPPVVELPPVVSQPTTPPLTLHVALGDSYSSGAGAESTPNPSPADPMRSVTVDLSVYERDDSGNIDACGRTNNNAARRIAAARGYTLRDVSCAGAVTGNLLTAGQHGRAAQLTAVTADAALVTLTIGGNDTQLLSLVSCLADTECTAASPQAITTAGLNDELQGRIAAVLAEVARRAPHAQVRIAGYPYIVPVPGGPIGACSGVVSDGERVLMKSMHDATNAAIRAAANASTPRVRYVDPTAPGSPFGVVDGAYGRDVCGFSTSRWINGAIDQNAYSSWHPNSIGYGFYAQLYLASL